MIQQNHFRPAANLLQIAERMALSTNRAAVHSDPEAMGTAGRFRRTVIQIPDFQTPLVIPFNPLAVNGIVPVLGTGKRLTCFLAEFTNAVLAITDTVAGQSAPAIIGKSVG